MIEKDKQLKVKELSKVIIVIKKQKKLHVSQDTLKKLAPPSQSYSKGVGGTSKRLRKKKSKKEDSTEAQKLFMRNYFVTTMGGKGKNIK